MTLIFALSYTCWSYAVESKDGFCSTSLSKSTLIFKPEAHNANPSMCICYQMHM